MIFERTQRFLCITKFRIFLAWLSSTKTNHSKHCRCSCTIPATLLGFKSNLPWNWRMWKLHKRDSPRRFRWFTMHHLHSDYLRHTSLVEKLKAKIQTFQVCWGCWSFCKALLFADVEVNSFFGCHDDYDFHYYSWKLVWGYLQLIRWCLFAREKSEHNFAYFAYMIWLYSYSFSTSAYICYQAPTIAFILTSSAMKVHVFTFHITFVSIQGFCCFSFHAPTAGRDQETHRQLRDLRARNT